MPSKHARLSPSAADRWIHCPGSVKLSEGIPSESSAYAEEGTLAHSMAELKLRIRTVPGNGRTAKANRMIYQGRLEELRQDPLCSGEMDEATELYADRVMEIYNGAGEDAELLVEQHFSLEEIVPGGFGTSDAVVIGGDTIEVIDLKYGKGVRVDAPENPQLRLYGLGAALLFGDIYDLHTVRMTIIQPRLDHVSTEELPLQALFNWAEITVKPAAEAALKNNAPTAWGDWCRWCPAKAICRTRADAMLRLAKEYDFAKPPILTTDELGDVLQMADRLKDWVTDLQDYALQHALQGEHFDGWKLVEGRSVRRYADDLKVAETLQAAGYPEAVLYERKLLGLTAMEKLVGKKKLTETLGDLIVKPAGKPVLVPVTDKRPELKTDAAADFAEEEDLPFV